MLNSIFDTTTSSITGTQFIICIFVSLAIGVFFAILSGFKNQSSESFVITLALLPAIVCVVIMMVNGNVGAGVAVAGAFSLVRFRSLPGTAREIGMLFMAMAAGLITGMGYLGFAAIFAIVVGAAMLFFSAIGLGRRRSAVEKTLRITVPEDLNYGELFDDLLQEYTSKHEVVSVKTTNMGSMFKLTYSIILKEQEKEKEFIDELRCRNGNLEISIARQEAVNYEL